MGAPATERFREAAASHGLAVDVVTFPADTRTAQQAADALGCELGQIVKSLVFRAEDEFVLVLTSGSNRVDQARAAAVFGTDQLGRANADECRAATGFAIGGIPPCGHPTPLRTALDRDLLHYDRVWAAAGAPDSVFGVTPDALVRATRAIIAEVADTAS